MYRGYKINETKCDGNTTTAVNNWLQLSLESFPVGNYEVQKGANASTPLQRVECDEEGVVCSHTHLSARFTYTPSVESFCVVQRTPMYSNWEWITVAGRESWEQKQSLVPWNVATTWSLRKKKWFGGGNITRHSEIAAWQKVQSECEGQVSDVQIAFKVHNHGSVPAH